jgi:hypothetical protein
VRHLDLASPDGEYFGGFFGHKNRLTIIRVNLQNMERSAIW